MTGTFEIEVDRVHPMLLARGEGFWSPETARAYLAHERGIIDALGVAVEDLAILFDASRFAVQSQAVIDILIQPDLPLYRARRAAFVAPPGLCKLQIRRGTSDRGVTIFASEDEARTYLLG